MSSKLHERAHMPASQRAKQFLPFDAVAGLRQALKMKEHEMGLITRKELSEETAEDINETLGILKPGDHVSVAYFRESSQEEGEMALIIGKVVGMSESSRTVTVIPDDGESDMHGFTAETVIKTDDIMSIDLFAEEL
ncbi:MAG: hypothetical protein IKF54_04330 [Eubacterium sp.]|nr:hypothetical protein [Eubacterium sp.]